MKDMKVVSRIEAKKARSEKIRVIIYNRVSTNKQEDEGSSLETQREDNIAYCQEHGYEIIDIVDETHTGYELEHRKKFKEILRRCVSGEVGGIVFRTYDRLSRNDIHRTVIEYDAERYGYALICSKEQYNDDSFESRLMRQLMSAFAEIERMKIKERTLEGRRKRAESGKLLNGSKARYGYLYNTKRDGYIINEEEAKIIHHIDDLYLGGTGMQAISLILTQEGIPTPTGKGAWSTATIQGILSCTEYHGEGYAYMYKKFKEDGKVKTRKTENDERLRLPEHVFPIIRDKKTFDTIEECRKNGNATSFPSRGNLKEGRILRGIVKCKICGGTMTPVLNHDMLYYRCAGAHFSNIAANKHDLSIASHKLETSVELFIDKLKKDVKKVRSALMAYLDSHTPIASIESYSNAIAKLKEQQVELSDSLGLVRGNAKETLIAKINKIEDDIEALDAERSKIEAKGSNWEMLRGEIEATITWLDKGNVEFKDMDANNKHNTLVSLGINVLVHKTAKRRISYEIVSNMGVPIPTLSSIG